jgi:ParB family chromosome partitioning protein
MPIASLPISKLSAHPLNRRLQEDSPEMEALKLNIKTRMADGLEPLINLPVVRKYKSGWQIVCGHRRLSALASLGVKAQRVVVRELDDQQTLQCLRLDNLHRQNLSGVEILETIIQMKSEGQTNQQIGQLFGQGSKWASNAYALRSLDKDVLESAREKGLSLNSLHVLSRKPKHEKVRPATTGAIQVVRPWKVKRRGTNYVLMVELSCETKPTVDACLRFMGI